MFMKNGIKSKICKLYFSTNVSFTVFQAFVSDDGRHLGYLYKATSSGTVGMSLQSLLHY